MTHKKRVIPAATVRDNAANIATLGVTPVDILNEVATALRWYPEARDEVKQRLLRIGIKLPYAKVRPSTVALVK
ncbi:MAG: hypothetical protein A2Y38_14635 [Spirochaetes bacterium GWB1_59_5]|nr:MAG: hypothetical protein A2Y38_14635 [Spirochaetes bacterium GWB1_59_5]